MNEVRYTLLPHQYDNIRAKLEDGTLRDDHLPETYGEETIRLYELFKMALLTTPDLVHITFTSVSKSITSHRATFCSSCQLERVIHRNCDTADAKKHESARMEELGFTDQSFSESIETARKRGHVAGKDYVRASELFPSLNR